MAFPITPSIGDKHIVGNVSYEWNGYAWDADAVVGSASVTKYEYTATDGQTVFAAAGYRSKKYVDVYINGMKLSETDFTASDEATVVLNAGATVGDLVVIEVSDAVIMADIIKTVGVTTLASGAAATVGYVDGALEFGIPAGPQGIQGIKGDTGADGISGAQLNIANTFTAPQRTSTIAQTNAINFTLKNNFTINATVGIISASNLTGCSGQSGVIVIESAENVTGWGAEFNFKTVPTSMSGMEVFSYFVQTETVIRIGRVS